MIVALRLGKKSAYVLEILAEKVGKEWYDSWSLLLNNTSFPCPPKKGV